MVLRTYQAGELDLSGSTRFHESEHRVDAVVVIVGRFDLECIANLLGEGETKH